MLSVPDSIRRRIRDEYPSIVVRWNSEKSRFEIFERYFEGVVQRLRHLWDYENLDGTALPLVGDRLTSWLHQADTRKWPLEDRMKLYDREDEEETESRKRALSNEVQSIIIDDYTRIAGIPTFFMNPAFKARAGREIT